jgi:MFS family permease
MLAGFYTAAGLVRSEPALIGVLSLISFSAAAIYVNSMPLIYERTNPGQTGAVSGIYMLLLHVAAALGPQIVGVLIDVNGRNYQMVFAFPAVVMAIAAALFLRSPQPTPLVMPAAEAAPLPE